MAGTGPAPEAKRRRRNKDTFGAEQTIVAADAKPDRCPPLPGATAYSRSTRAWYRIWCASPQATLFLPTDWQRLHMLAPLVEAFYAEPTPKAFAEIRLSESLLGATHLDRLRGRIGVQWPEPDTEPLRAVGDLDARRHRLTDEASAEVPSGDGGS